MDNIFTSSGQLKVGDSGEITILNFLKNLNTYKDVIILKDSKYNHLRKFDIDYVCSKTGKIDDNVLLAGNIDEINALYDTVELKTDTRIHSTGNMFLEDTMFRKSDNKQISGYMNKCKAKLFFYYDSYSNILYGANFSKFKKYYDENKQTFKQPSRPTVSELVGSKELCYVYGYLVPVNMLIKNGLVKPVKL